MSDTSESSHDLEGRRLTPQNDFTTALAFELIRNGAPIDWAYWTAVRPSAAQAARLAHFIDPIKWTDDVYEAGSIPSDLCEKVARLQIWLEQNWPFPTITLGHLVRVLGGNAGATLRAAAEPELAALKAESEATHAQEARRRAAGRYFLEEAAEALAGDIDFERWLETILDAVRRGELPLRNPRNYLDNLPYPVPNELRTFYDQVHFEDVNGWLESHPEWTSIRLTGQDVDERDDVSVKPESDRRGITKQQILAQEWPVKLNLHKALSDTNNHKWLLSARVSPGRAGKRSAKWHPAQLGICLCSKGHAPKRAIARHLAKNFPEWLDYWEEHSEHLQ